MSKIIRLLPHFIKVRLLAKKFDIWKEVQDDNRKPDAFMSGDWISYDGNLYYGHPLGVFLLSNQNELYQLNKQYRDKYDTTTN
jgi:hypothetical protein